MYPKTWNGETLEQLLAKNYRRVSNKYRIVSRIDRPDWREVMGSPWQSKKAKRIRGEVLGEDQYRRIYSEDNIENVPLEIFRQIPGS